MHNYRSPRSVMPASTNQSRLYVYKSTLHAIFRKRTLAHLSLRHLSFSEPAGVTHVLYMYSIRAHIRSRRPIGAGLIMVFASLILFKLRRIWAREYSCCCFILSSKRLAINERRSLVDGVNSRRARTPGD